MQHDVEPNTGRKILRPESISLDIRQPEPGELRATLTDSSRKMARSAAAATWAHVQGRELTDEERAIVKRIAFIARLMDNAVKVPGTDYYIGLDPLIGLVPLYGDWVTCGVSLYVLIEAIRLGTPPDILVKMAANIGVDVVVGFVPGLGDVFDVFFKANSRNMRLIQQDVLGLPPVESENFQDEWDQLIAAVEDAEIVEDEQTETSQEAPTETATQAETASIDIPTASNRQDVQLLPAHVSPNPSHSEGARIIPMPKAPARAKRHDDDGHSANTLAPRRGLALRDPTPLQQAIGYTLVFGLVTLFMLPWAFFAWLAFSAFGG
ncbi:MAG: DUF4112 domain-containing protein [Myxococcota bacterium]